VSIAEIKKLPLADEIQIMEALWEDLCSQPDQVEIPEWHRSGNIHLDLSRASNAEKHPKSLPHFHSPH